MTTGAQKILLVDDEPDILEILSYNLKKEGGYIIETAGNGEDAIFLASHFLPDLILLDVMMPELDGFETLRRLHKNPKLKKTKYIFLTAKIEETSEILGLKLGADDYITKPIRLDLLLVRIKTVLRRGIKTQNPIILSFGNLSINPEEFVVIHDHKKIQLARKEFNLLLTLASNPDRVFPRAELLRQVWGNEVIVGDRTIDVHIRKIRQKLGVDVIKTIKGIGYKFEYPL